MENRIDTGSHEKRAAAFTSVVAAIALTMLKLTVGLMTNSLGILAEAAHSALDLVAALVTFFAVRVSDKPADPGHPYGHGKVENLSALFETLLLLVTCVWIIYESISRLFFRSAEVIPSAWGFVVMGVSIAVDASRSRLLYRTAKKYGSQALEADALHFSTDIWSSAVVILGLAGVQLASRSLGLSFLRNTDAIAALVVAAIVIYVSIQLGVRAVQALLDHAPAGLQGEIKRVVEVIPEIIDCHHIRIRTSGPRIFVDVHVTVPGERTLQTAHDLTVEVEEAVRKIAPTADVTVHAEPASEAIADGNPATGRLV